MNSNGISDREGIETLLEFAPVAMETAKMHVEAELGDLWKQQVRKLAGKTLSVVTEFSFRWVLKVSIV